MSYTDSSTDKETNKNCINPTEMIGKTKLLILKCQELHFEPLIDVLTPKLDMNLPEDNSHNIFNNVDESQKKYLAENMCNFATKFTKSIRQNLKA